MTTVRASPEAQTSQSRAKFDMHPLLVYMGQILSFFARPITIIRTYQLANLRYDLTAGLTVAIISLPQAIAFALISELPAQVGLYTAVVGTVVGAMWGSSNHLQTGPTNTTSLLVLSTLLAVALPNTPEYLAAAGMMALLVGLFWLLLGLARLGVLVNFVSDSVIVGFTSGAGLLLIFNQVRNLLRLDIPSMPTLIDQAIQAALAEIWPLQSRTLNFCEYWTGPPLSLQDSGFSDACPRVFFIRE